MSELALLLSSNFQKESVRLEYIYEQYAAIRTTTKSGITYMLGTLSIKKELYTKKREIATKYAEKIIVLFGFTFVPLIAFLILKITILVTMTNVNISIIRPLLVDKYKKKSHLRYIPVSLRLTNLFLPS